MCSSVAKILVNSKESMQLFQQGLKGEGGEDIQLMILKELPSSICYSTKSILYGKQETGQLFRVVTPLLLRVWNHSPKKSLEVIENFVQSLRVDILDNP